MRVLISFLASIFIYHLAIGQNISPFIHVDQFGYQPNAVKVAVLSNPILGYNSNLSYSPANELELKDATSNTTVFSASPQLWNNGNTHSQSGDQGYWFDFSSFTTNGEYYIYDRDNNERSATFRIHGDVYNDVLKVASRMFYYNRCGIAKEAPYAEANWTDNNSFLQDANCRYAFDPNNATLEKDMSGGWFDAGDYNKYVTFAYTTIHDLLYAYEENVTAFGDDWNLPESGNGVPDILDEIKWELDWLLKMINNDGSVHIKMGSISYSDNGFAPPSLNTDTRYYGPTCTAASIAVASMFAHAAKIFQSISALSAYGNLLETEAEKTWAYALPFLNDNTLEEACDDGTVKSGDADWTAAKQKEAAVGASIYLFDLTGKSTYNNYVVDHIDETEPMIFGDWNSYDLDIIDALLLYTSLSGIDENTRDEILTSVQTTVTNNWNNYYEFNNLDLYRGYMPDWSYHWGSNSPKASIGALNNVLVKYGIVPNGESSYQLKASEQLHYFHGVNPLGLVYLSNMYDYGGDRCVNELYHGWFNDGTDWDHVFNSTYGPAPGYLVGGPNSTYEANTALTPPYNQPLQKSYLDFNTTSDASWEITEPAIYYQAAYIRLLASASESTLALPVVLEKFEANVISPKEVQLSWTTSTEKDNAFFHIEKSKDGTNWELLKKVDAIGNSTIANHYNAVDDAPFLGTSYYRLKQVDQNGDYTHSPIRSVVIESVSNIRAFPNPVAEKLSIQHELTDGHLEIRNIQGQLVKNMSIHSASSLIDCSRFSKGMYFMTIRDIAGNIIWTQKMIKS